AAIPTQVEQHLHALYDPTSAYFDNPTHDLERARIRHRLINQTAPRMGTGLRHLHPRRCPHHRRHARPRPHLRPPPPRPTNRHHAHQPSGRLPGHRLGPHRRHPRNPPHRHHAARPQHSPTPTTRNR